LSKADIAERFPFLFNSYVDVVFSGLLKTIENFKIFLLNTPNRFFPPSNKILLKKIETVLLPQTMMADTKIKKNI